MRKLDYRTAVRLLDEDEAIVRSLDRALGGILLGAAAFHPSVLALFDAKSEATELSRKLVRRVKNRILHSGESRRRDLVGAAHTIVVIDAYFSALADAFGRSTCRNLEITEPEKLALMRVSPTESSNFVDQLLSVDIPLLGAGVSLDERTNRAREIYSTTSQTLLRFLSGLVAWESVDDIERTRLHYVIDQELASIAAEMYRANYMRLAADVVEFHIWANFEEMASVRKEILALGSDVASGFRRMADLVRHNSTAMADVPALLRGMAPGSEWETPTWLKTMQTLDRKVLGASLLDSSMDAHPQGIVLPTIEAGYVTPNYRAAKGHDSRQVASEDWWASQACHSNLQVRLAGLISSPEGKHTPIVVLGHPGSGKSLLTQVLAAQLPRARYAVVRVSLRHVTSSNNPLGQIESAIATTTNEHVSWRRFCDETVPLTRVVLLDGLDELVQLGLIGSHGDYLTELRRIQEVEADRGTPVSFIVTARTVSFSRIEVPTGSTVLKLEDFNSKQIKQWIEMWNCHNRTSFEARGVASFTVEGSALKSTIARQPLLLMMLALYDAADNALQRKRGLLSTAALYENLISDFLRRELTRGGLLGESLSARRGSSRAGLDTDRLVEERMQELSVVGYALLNRGSQYIRSEELARDLEALGISRTKPSPVGETRQERTTPEEIAEQFFFIFSSEAKLSSVQQNRSYEFLHATFGEFFVAREVVVQLNQMVSHELAASGPRSPEMPLGDRLFAMLSFRPLYRMSQVPIFIQECSREQFEDERRRKTLLQVLSSLLLSAESSRLPDRFMSYAPAEVSLPQRVAIWQINLTLILALVQPKGSELALVISTAHREDLLDGWQRRLAFWQSQIHYIDWLALVSHFTLSSPGSSSRLMLRWRRNISSDDMDRTAWELEAELARNTELRAVALVRRLSQSLFGYVTAVVVIGRDTYELSSVLSTLYMSCDLLPKSVLNDLLSVTLYALREMEFDARASVLLALAPRLSLCYSKMTRSVALGLGAHAHKLLNDALLEPPNPRPEVVGMPRNASYYLKPEPALDSSVHLLEVDYPPRHREKDRVILVATVVRVAYSLHRLSLGGVAGAIFDDLADHVRNLFSEVAEYDLAAAHDWLSAAIDLGAARQCRQILFELISSRHVFAWRLNPHELASLLRAELQHDLLGGVLSDFVREWQSRRATSAQASGQTALLHPTFTSFTQFARAHGLDLARFEEF